MPLAKLVAAHLLRLAVTRRAGGHLPNMVAVLAMLAAAAIGVPGPPYPWQNHTLPVSVPCRCQVHFRIALCAAAAWPLKRHIPTCTNFLASLTSVGEQGKHPPEQHLGPGRAPACRSAGHF